MARTGAENDSATTSKSSFEPVSIAITSIGGNVEARANSNVSGTSAAL
jgi:hypothetical protein